MTELSVQIDQDQLNKVQYMMAGVRNGYKRAVVRASNSTATSVKSLTANALYAELNLKKPFINEKIAIKKATFNSLWSRVRVSSASIALPKYGSRQFGYGVRVSVRRGTYERHTGAFHATMKSGHIGVYTRGTSAGGITRRKPAPRREKRDNVWGSTVLPIDQHFGPSLAPVFHHHGETEVFNTGMALYGERFADQVDLLLRQ